jgi:hypothetical protein
VETPVLFLIFNRPEETAKVFAAIRAQRPKRLFIASDGPRADRIGEQELVARTRAVALAVDWPCDVSTLLRETNLGCGPAVSGAISWFFEHVEEGIILEDDCLPNQDFFPFCETMLERYRDDARAASVAGTNFLPPVLEHGTTHYASKYFQMWGWASWRRAWTGYDFALRQRDEAGWNDLLKRVHPHWVEAAYWREVLKALFAGTIDTWDFQAFFSAWHGGACHLMPARNLVSNLGYGPAATHTNFASRMGNLPTFPLAVGPEKIDPIPDPAIDNLIFYLRFLDSMDQTWWLEQILDPAQKLGEARAELHRKDRYIRQLEREVVDRRRQLVAAGRALAEAQPSSAV